MKLYDKEMAELLSENTIDNSAGLVYDTGKVDDSGDMIAVFIPFTEQELIERRIGELKQRLANTDYQAIKYAEGEISEVDYADIRTQRAECRKEINELEEKL